MTGDDGHPSTDHPVDSESGDDGHPSTDHPVDSESGDDGLDSNGGQSRVAEDGSRPDSDLLEDRLADAREERHRPETLPNAGSQTGALEQYSGVIRFTKEVLTSVAAVVLVGALLFAISGVWPPMVAVESGSMEPVMERGDLVFITEPGRYAPDVAHGETGVVTVETGRDSGFTSFDGHGSVVVYDDPTAGGSPIIHRAHLWVEEDENWYDRANPEYVSANNCAQLTNCPAPHAGFITKGDANARYDQANGISDPVRPEWVTGVAQVRIPYLGWIRLSFGSLSNAPTTTNPGTFPVVSTVPTEPIDSEASTVVESGGPVGVVDSIGTGDPVGVPAPVESTLPSVSPIRGGAAMEAPPTGVDSTANSDTVRPADASGSAERCPANDTRSGTRTQSTAVGQ